MLGLHSEPVDVVTSAGVVDTYDALRLKREALWDLDAFVRVQPDGDNQHVVGTIRPTRLVQLVALTLPLFVAIEAGAVWSFATDPGWGTASHAGLWTLWSSYFVRVLWRTPRLRRAAHERLGALPVVPSR